MTESPLAVGCVGGLTEQSLLSCEDPGSPLSPPTQQEQFSAISCPPAKGEASVCKPKSSSPPQLTSHTRISHRGSPGALIGVPKLLIFRKGWVFITT